MRIISSAAVVCCCVFSSNAASDTQKRLVSDLSIKTEKINCPSDLNESDIRTLVSQEATKQGVDEKLALAIADNESANGAKQNSEKGARGPMQLTPDTAALYGVADICDASENVRGGISYIKDLSAEFHGNVLLVAAAYNAGPDRVYQARGVPAISETVRYVAAVTNHY